MIIDIERFVNREQPLWRELEAVLKGLEENPGVSLGLPALRRLHYLYQKAGADLAKVSGQSAAPELRRYLEALVARAYAEIHENRRFTLKLSPGVFYGSTFPRAFRKHARAFALALLVTVVGALAGSVLLAWDPEAKSVVLPFDHLAGTPSERVAREETKANAADAPKASFSSYLMTHNIKVSIFTLALGFAWGAGSLLLLFYNGVILGAVSYDYIADGQLVFLLGWLMPHGVIEIPAILLAGQAGFVLGVQVLKGSRGGGLGPRLRSVAPDVAALMGGIATMLVWAGIIEAFFSQYHAPVIPYWAKISFGCLELAALIWYLGFVGRGAPSKGAASAAGKEAHAPA